MGSRQAPAPLGAAADDADCADEKATFSFGQLIVRAAGEKQFLISATTPKRTASSSSRCRSSAPAQASAGTCTNRHFFPGPNPTRTLGSLPRREPDFRVWITAARMRYLVENYIR